MKYKAIFLDDKEFERLPYREMESKVGVADPKTGTAYARTSNVPIIDAFNIMHELEHLEDGHEGEHADHYDPEHGVYYKGFGDMFGGMGQGLSNLGGAFSRGAGGITRGVQGLFGGGPQPTEGRVSVDPLRTASGAGKQSPLSMLSGGRGFNSPMSMLPGRSTPSSGSVMSQFQGKGGFNAPMSALPKSGGGGPSFNLNFGGGQSSWNAPSGRSNWGQPPTPPSGPGPAKPSSYGLSGAGIQTPKQPSFFQNLVGKGGNATQLGAGAALAGFGQLAAPKVKVPNLAELPSVQRLSNMNFSNFKEMDPALAEALNRDFDQIDARERDQLIATYKSLRPGADIESDSSFRRDIMELQDSQGKRRTDQLAKYRFEFISKQLQLSQLELQQMQQLAEYDIATIAAQLNIDAADAQAFKETFGNLGGMFASSGLGLNQAPAEKQNVSS